MLPFFVHAGYPAPASAGPAFLLEWGDFFSPRWVAVDANGDVFVSELIQVQKFDEFGTFLARLGEVGTGDGQFQNPNGLATDGQGVLYTTEHGFNQRVQRWTTATEFLGNWGEPGAGEGQFQSPQGVVVAPGNVVYVVDRGNSRVQKFTSTGDFLGAWGSQGSGPGDFAFPTGITLDSQGDLYVTDTGNHRIQKFDADGTFLEQWGRRGLGNGEFESPRGIVMSPWGVLYVADEGNHRIQEFSSSGEFLGRWGANGGDGTSGVNPGEFWNPNGVAVDPVRGYLYVADMGNARVQKFSSPTPVQAVSWARIKGNYMHR